jgi:hypothetical protein
MISNPENCTLRKRGVSQRGYSIGVKLSAEKVEPDRGKTPVR